MAVVLWVAAGSDASWLEIGAGARAMRLASLVALGATVYFAALLALGFRLRDFALTTKS
jgi:putative peptidoglycan lipid II flippase